MHLEVYTTSYPLICLWIKSVMYVTIWGFLIVFTFVLGLYQVKTRWEVFHIRSRIFRESSLKHVKPKLNFKSHFLWHAWLQSKWCFLGSNFQEIGLPQKKKKRKKRAWIWIFGTENVRCFTVMEHCSVNNENSPLDWIIIAFLDLEAVTVDIWNKLWYTYCISITWRCLPVETHRAVAHLCWIPYMRKSSKVSSEEVFHLKVTCVGLIAVMSKIATNWKNTHCLSDGGC